jgi:hypothetical protein
VATRANLIAAAFRFAICLDRILVLLPINQEATISKWRHPGCSGTTFECYFQTIHGCVADVHPKNIPSPSRREEVQFFESYPLKNERILVLQGDQLVIGPCASCYDSWSEKSRFFDGLPAIGRINAQFQYDVFDQWAQILSPVRVLWQSHFLRFLLRPRPWFEQTMRQWVDLTMYSPLSATTAKSIDISSATLLRREQFPLNYASLHIRFG